MNIRLIGIGLEELGVEDFVKGGFFNGVLYVDSKQQCYKDLGFRRMRFYNLISLIFSKKARNAYAQAKKEKAEGNMRGDTMQNGGLLIVGIGGTVLLSYRQESHAEHEDIANILKILGIDQPVEVPQDLEPCDDGMDLKGVVCERDVCPKT